MKKSLIALIAVLVCSLVVFSSGAIGFDEPLSPKVITITAADGTVVTIPMGGTDFTDEEGYGGTIYNRPISFDAGIEVDGTTVIDGSGNIDAPITSTTGTFSSTLAVTGAATLSDDLIVDTNTLVVDDSANGVGFGTTTPSASLVVGSSDNFTVAGATGNVSVGGTLGVTGAATLSSTLGVTGAATLSSTLAVTGESNLDTLVYGGDTTDLGATTTAQTLTAAQVCDSAHISWNSMGANVNLTLPTAAAVIADCLTTAGDTKSFLFENEGAGNITIVAGTAMELLEPSGGDVVIATTEFADIELTMITSTTTAVTVTSLRDAD